VNSLSSSACGERNRTRGLCRRAFSIPEF